MTQIFSFLTFASIVLVIFFSGTCKNDSPVKPPPPPATPDTTTHQYAWEEILVSGNTGFVEFFDVWAFAPDNVWVVGKIQDYDYPDTCYPNVYHWNGKEWNFKSIAIRALLGPDTGIARVHAPINAIWGFSPNDILLTSETGGRSYARIKISGKDTTVESHFLIQYGGGQGHIWAVNPYNIYIAGDRGDAIFYDGNIFKAINTNLPNFSGAIIDLWASDKSHIFASIMASNWPDSPDYFLMYNGTNWETLWQSDISPSLSDSVFFGFPGATWGVTGEDSMYVSGLWIGKMKNDGTGKIRALLKNDKYGAYTIRGTSKNNIFFAGGAGNIIHWNGSTFYQYKNFLDKPYYPHKVFVLENDVYIVGETFNSHTGVILHGRKNN